MSFILDALKKSEHERQRQTIPGLVDSSVVRPKPRLPMWAIALCVLLGVNLIVLLLVLLHGWMTPSPAPATQVQNQPASRVQQPSQARASLPAAAPGTNGERQFSPLDNSPRYATEIPLGSAPLPTTPPQRNSASGSNSATHTVRHGDPLLNDGDYQANDEEVLPTINEMNLTGAQGLPDLHLDVHVFATRSAERFVFINMRKYHEGAVMQEGPTIERIRRDGVILDYHGVRFLLPRQ